jgi:hypothetical protein
MSCPCFGAEFPYEKNGTDGVLVDATHQEPQVRMRVAQVEYSGGRRQKGDERRPLKAASQSVERWHTHTYTHFFDGSCFSGTFFSCEARTGFDVPSIAELACSFAG